MCDPISKALSNVLRNQCGSLSLSFHVFVFLFFHVAAIFFFFFFKKPVWWVRIKCRYSSNLDLMLIMISHLHRYQII